MPNIPPNLDRLFQLAVQHHQAGRLAEAEHAYRQILMQQPNHPEAVNHLGVLAVQAGQHEIALDLFRQAVSLRPSYPEAQMNLGNSLMANQMPIEAIAAFRQAILLKPDYADAHYNLGNALYSEGNLDEAVASFRQAVALRPRFAEAHNNLGNVLFHKGELDKAIAAYREAITLNPNNAEHHGNLVFALSYHPDFDPFAIAAEAGRWNTRHGEPLRQFIQPHQNDRNPDRRLKIGYVSPDFRAQAVGRFLLPLLAEHDHNNFEIVCYSTARNADAVTDQLRGFADQWRSLVGLSDAQAAELIRNDQIDILVDLSLHTAQNRLTLFARKPAPVQVTYLAYPGTSGLRAIDYRLSDPYLDPPPAASNAEPGTDESVYSEKTIRLPQTYWCFQPIESPPIGSLPALWAGHVTFGCLNNFSKVSRPALETWVRLLQAVPESNLLLHALEGSHRQRVVVELQKSGIDPQRLRFVGKAPMIEYLHRYQQIDIALDPFPFNGGTTTCDALWMGVPVVTLRGETAVGRGGLSILNNVGLPELVATTREQYIQIATGLANDLPCLAELRATLRDRMQRSPLMDAPQFARGVEAAYRQMWSRWCAEESI